MLVAVIVAFVVSYSSMKMLHGMIDRHPEDAGYNFESLLRGSMPEEKVRVDEHVVSREETSLETLTQQLVSPGSLKDKIDGDNERQEQQHANKEKEWEEEYLDKKQQEEEEKSDEGIQDEVDDALPREEQEDTRDEDDLEEEYESVDPRELNQSTPGSTDSSYAQENGFEVKRHTDYWGDAVVWGNDNLKDSEEECCKSCVEYTPKTKHDAPCNVWVYCGSKELCKSNYKHCWLKYLAHPEGTSPANEGPMIGWTTGIKSNRKQPISSETVEDSSADRSYHIVVSAQGTATHWQSRVHYYWYKKIKKQCEAAGRCDMGGFTRLLHEGKADDLIEEIPTFVAKQLPKEHPHHGYIVLNRPYAFLQWVQQAKIKEKYVLMGEPDHIWLKPLPNMMKGENPAAFPFFYIEPTKEEYINITEKFVGKLESVEQKAQLYPIGSSPTMLSLKDMKKIVPIWYNISLAVHEDDEAVKAWGWVQEMYAFTMSMYLAGVKECGLYPEWMAQPPWDSDLEKFYLLHYTYGMDYKLDGTFTPGKYGEWRFDKRSYADKPLPRNLGPPPKGMQNGLVRHLIDAFNEATNAIPDWDIYEKTGKVTKLWDGVLKDKR